MYLEVERHAADAVLELDHLAGLDVVEAVDAGDAVADREDAADLGHFRFSAEALDLFFQDGGDFRGADVHVFKTSSGAMSVLLPLWEKVSSRSDDG